MLATWIAAMVEEELEQTQVVVAEVTAQEEIAAQSAVEILDHGTGPDRVALDVVQRLADREIAFAQEAPQRRVTVPAFGAVDGKGLHPDGLTYQPGTDGASRRQLGQVAVD